MTTKEKSRKLDFLLRKLNTASTSAQVASLSHELLVLSRLKASDEAAKPGKVAGQLTTQEKLVATALLARELVTATNSKQVSRISRELHRLAKLKSVDNVNVDRTRKFAALNGPETLQSTNKFANDVDMLDHWRRVPGGHPESGKQR